MFVFLFILTAMFGAFGSDDEGPIEKAGDQVEEAGDELEDATD
jgi:hypothetical protein